MFEIPLLLTGLSAIAIPIIIHLLHRQKATPIQWGAVMFLVQTDVLKKRFRNLDQWLLLLLRVLAMLLLALLLAWPVMRSGAVNQLAGGSSADVAIVLDHSISTGLIQGRGTVFSREIAMVKRMITALGAQDTVSVVIAGHRPYSLTQFPISVSDPTLVRTKLLDPLKELAMGTAGTSIPAAIEEARRVARRGVLIDKIIFVVSDQRAIAWHARENGVWKAAYGGVQPPSTLAVFSLPVIPRPTTSDISIGPLHLEPDFPGVGRKVRVLFTVSNSGPQPVRNIPVSLLFDGTVVDHDTIPQLQAGGSTSGVLHFRINSMGSHWIRVRTSIHDALAADNQSTAVVQVWQDIPVLIIDSQLGDVGDFRASRFLKAALRPSKSRSLGLAKPTVMSVNQADHANLAHYQAVIVNDPAAMPAGLLSRLHAYAESGGGVWFIFGPNANRTFVNTTLPQSGFTPGKLGPVQSAGKKSPSIVILDSKSRLLRPLAKLNRNAIVGVTLMKWRQITPANSMEKVVLATSGGDPLMLSQPIGNSGGRLVVWSTGADGRWNDWPLEAGSFVPLVDQTTYELAMGSKRLSIHHFLNPGEPMVWTGPATPAITSATILDPHHLAHVVKPQLMTGGQYLITWNHTGLPGLYTLSFKPAHSRTNVYFNVNIDMRQLNPSPLSAADVHWLIHHKYLRKQITAKQIGWAMGTVSPNLSLWPILTMVLLLMLVLEALQCHKMAKLTRARESTSTALPAMSILDH